MDMLSSKKDVEVTPLWQRIFWGSITGVIAIVLLLNGGLGTLQAVSTTTAFPFSIVILISIYGLFKALRMDIGKIDIRSKANMYVQPSTRDSGGWQKRLRNVTVYPRRDNVIKFMNLVVLPAFEDVKAEFVKQGLALMNPLMILVKIIKLRWIHILSYDQMVSRKINNQTTRCANSIFYTTLFTNSAPNYT
ncbi:hypothetical protein CI641_027060 [Escherichia coli]|uniref:BCCT family transporter n=1 Tax=Escherichia coli TaxID=562 RepID=UPI00112256F1|nr:BCCT family transporter [Escherichia coli]TNK44106.1 hypothetical protein CI641_027060 [Escherichia coli]